MTDVHNGWARSVPQDMTRDCIDPWTYIEIQPNGDIKPCCARPPIGNVQTSSLSEVVNGAEVRTLRRELLSGELDYYCSTCVLREPVSIQAFHTRIEGILDQVKLPQDFKASEYLAANADVVEAGVDAVEHFLAYGRFEGRSLSPPAKR